MRDKLEARRDQEKSEVRLRARRDFVRLALSSIPATGLLMACEAGQEGSSTSSAGSPAVAVQGDPLLDACPDDDSRQLRSRWLQLHASYVGYRNQHDLTGIAACFAAEASMIVNERPFRDAQSIADAHTMFGMSSAPGGLVGTQVVPDRELFTDEELLIQGRIFGTHVGRVLHFVPSFQPVELHYAALYRFDDGGKIVSERIVMNWAQLAGG